MRARHLQGSPVWALIAAFVAMASPSFAAAQPDAGQPPTDSAAQPEPQPPAPEPSQQDTERARALFEQGVTEGDRGRWEDAVTNFRAALQLRDAPAIRYN